MYASDRKIKVAILYSSRVYLSDCQRRQRHEGYEQVAILYSSRVYLSGLAAILKRQEKSICRNPLFIKGLSLRL